MTTTTAPARDRAAVTEPVLATLPATSASATTRMDGRRRPARRVHLPRASTAVAVVVGTFVAFFPGRLPHGPVLQGATAALFVLAAVGIAGLLRRLRPLTSDRAVRFSRPVHPALRSDRAVRFSGPVRPATLRSDRAVRFSRPVRPATLTSDRAVHFSRPVRPAALTSDRAVHFSRPVHPATLTSDQAVHFSRLVHRLVFAGCAIALAATLAWTEVTQNAMRADVGWGPAGPGYWALLVATCAAVVALVLGLGWLWRRLRDLSRRLVRRLRTMWRPALALAVAGTVLVPATTVQGAPAAPAAAAAPASDQVLQRPSPTGAIRVYARLHDGESVAARADRAADELVHAGGLHKSRVVLVIPTGSGWVDENAVRGLERRFHGDVATVGLQYARVPSWVAYLFDRDGAEQAARALFRAVERRIQALPERARPDLHVYGESLGATAGQAIFEGGPSARAARRQVCSVLWVGSPGGATVGLPRETSVANDDDPIVHTSAALLFADPGDGRPWLPVVSFLQAGVDFVGSLAMPDGSGHRYGPGQVRHLQTCR